VVYFSKGTRKQLKSQLTSTAFTTNALTRTTGLLVLPVEFRKPLIFHSHLILFMAGKFYVERECNSSVPNGVTFPHVWLLCLAQKHKNNPTDSKLRDTPPILNPTARPDQEGRLLSGLLSSKISFLGSSGTLYNKIWVILRALGDYWWSHFLELR